PPLPPLFPYTTLFRSLRFRRGQRAAACGLGLVEDLADRALVVCHSLSRLHRQRRGDPRRRAGSNNLFGSQRPDLGVAQAELGERSEEHTSELQSLAYL